MNTVFVASLLGAAWLAGAAAAPVKTEGGLVEGTVADDGYCQWSPPESLRPRLAGAPTILS